MLKSHPVLPSYKVVILGSGGVGKSALTCQYVYNVFVENYDPTIEDQYQSIVEVDGIKVQLELLDTAGTEQFMALHSIYMKSGDGFVLVFSVTSMESLNELSSLRDQILRLKEVDGLNEDNVPLVLVGNKVDLYEERRVPREIPVALTAQTWRGVPYYETSARKNLNVANVFEDVVRQIIRLKNKEEEERRNKKMARRGGGMGYGAGGSGKMKCVIV